MKLIIQQSKSLKGKLTPPGSKSHTVRALFFATIAKGTSLIKNALDAEDTHSAISVCKAFGAKIKILKKSSGTLDITVKSNGIPLQTKSKKIFTENSGITTVFAMAIAGLRQNIAKPIILIRGKQMKQRPIDQIIQALNRLGMRARYISNDKSGHVMLSGKLKGGRISIDGLNSQYISAFLLALPCAERDSQITVNNLRERPYIEMTLQYLKEQNIRFNHSRIGKSDIFKIFRSQKYSNFKKTIPADFSSASYPIAAAALLPGCVEINGLDMKDPQGDKKLIALLRQMGADIAVRNNIIKITGGKPLKGQFIDCADIPDLFPTLAVIAAQAKGKTTLSNLASARIKETDRVLSMKNGLLAMKAKLEEKDSALVIYKSELRGANVHGYYDHRTVMALAVAGLCAKGVTKISTAQSIKKTFPNFAEMMNHIGARMHMAH